MYQTTGHGWRGVKKNFHAQVMEQHALLSTKFSLGILKMSRYKYLTGSGNTMPQRTTFIARRSFTNEG